MTFCSSSSRFWCSCCSCCCWYSFNWEIYVCETEKNLQ